MEINLDGGEISVLKGIGLSGAAISGETLIERVPGLEEAELVDVLQGLIMLGYVISEKQSLYSAEDIKKSEFRVNSGYLKDLRDAVDPRGRPSKKSRRIRRE